MKFKFVADTILKGKAYPALAKWQATPYTPEWRQFVNHWPNTVPCELHEHCATHHYPYSITAVPEINEYDSFYTIGLGFFDFTIDYFNLIPLVVIEKVRQLKLQILFYYHEGDNPYRIKQRLDALCNQHQLDTNCYKFISGNTEADNIKNFIWFPDHELLFWHRNQETVATPVHTQLRPYKFTILNRTHKWWRATAMADLKRNGILESSQWSYNTKIILGDDYNDNPIEVDTLNIKEELLKFINAGPYFCDSLTSDDHNNHQLTVAKHYTDSYCNIVFETHFDADQSGGAFLTEKIFKPIKHGQPFVVVGALGSLQALRNLGYKTFDHAIDNRYDLESNNTQRWKMILDAVKQLEKKDMHAWFAECQADVKHNQQLFLSSKQDRLNMLSSKLTVNKT